ncbi:MAG: helix-turn-helix domain-containing protein [Candidatus Bathyarchaeota archaeon]|nr:helix-turn-helix domain-containing protein [Candidatus Bathyarchaeota archaeon]
MQNTDKIEGIIFQALAHQMRRTILKIVALDAKGVSYTELVTELGLSTGKLNYHLEQLAGFIEKNEERRYVLTPFGRKALNQLNLVKQEMSLDDEKYVRTAGLAQKTVLQPAAKLFLLIGIFMTSVVIFVWAYLAYIAVTEGAPVIVYLLLPILIAAGASLLSTLIYALRKTPEWVRRFEHKFLGEG